MGRPPVHGHFRGGKQTRTHAVWASMIQRCTNPRHRFYVDYGGRGITVCDRWRTFSNFLADMGEAPEGLTLERQRNHEGYQPGNCVWTTQTRQIRNRRNTIHVEIDGVSKSLAEWCEHYGINRHTVHSRVNAGATYQEALQCPSLCRGRSQPWTLSRPARECTTKNMS